MGLSGRITLSIMGIVIIANVAMNSWALHKQGQESKDTMLYKIQSLSVSFGAIVAFIFLFIIIANFVPAIPLGISIKVDSKRF